MIRLIRLILALVGLIVIVAFAIANRAPVEVSFAPLPFVVELPVYGVLLLGLVIGGLLGGQSLARDIELQPSSVKRHPANRQPAMRSVSAFHRASECSDVRSSSCCINCLLLNPLSIALLRFSNAWSACPSRAWAQAML